MEAIAKDKSLHDRILGDVEGRILSGEWPPGYRIPFEHELTEQFACSRMTVNKALSELVKKGLIERRRRLGSFVAHPRMQSLVMEIHDIPREVQALGLDYEYRLIALEIRPFRTGDRPRLDLVEGLAILEIRCCHMAGGLPFCFEERIINLSAVPEAALIDFSLQPPGSWLLGQVPWSEAEHRIRAVAATTQATDALELAPGTACLVIERRTWNSEHHITHVRLTYPGERHQLLAQFSPSHPG